MEKKILDVTCGSRTIWFNKNHPNALYCDRRNEEYELYFGKSHTNLRKCYVHPDVQCDFTKLPFEDNSFSLVVFDPPPSYWGKRNCVVGQEIRKTGRNMATDASRWISRVYACAEGGWSFDI